MRNFLIATTAVVGLMAVTADTVSAQSAFQRNVDRDNVVENNDPVTGKAFQRNDINRDASQYSEGIGALNTVSQKNVGRAGSDSQQVVDFIDYNVEATGDASASPLAGGEDFNDTNAFISVKNPTSDTLTVTAKDSSGNVLGTYDVAPGFYGAIPADELDGASNVSFFDEDGNDIGGTGSFLSPGEYTLNSNDEPFYRTVPGTEGTKRQLNVQRDNTVVNNEDVTARGTQRNVRAKNANQTVLAFGANHSGEQLNREGDGDVRSQKNRVVDNVAVNNEEVEAFGTQVNRAIVDNDTVDTVRNVEQTVSATGAGTVDSQTNRGGTFQTNVSAGNTVVNNDDARARGRQVNENVTRDATQDVFATGASQNTHQLNAGGTQQRNRTVGNTVVNNDGVLAVGRQINTVGTQSMRNANQTVSGIGASRNVGQTNR